MESPRSITILFLSGMNALMVVNVHIDESVYISEYFAIIVLCVLYSMFMFNSSVLSFSNC